jgi:hypothetical protein
MKGCTKLRYSVAASVLVGISAAWFGETVMAVVKPRSFSVPESYLRVTRAAPFPARQASALGGRAVLARIAELPARRREAAIFAELAAGNVPDHLRTMQPVRITTRDGRGREITGTVWALPDYLAVGSNDDYVRVPMNLETASRVAIHLGMALPTAKIVDDIYAGADIRLTPDPMPPTHEMTSLAYAVKHDDRIRQSLGLQLAPGALPLQRIIAGHKKDIVMTSRLERRGDRIAIFGWHRPNGRPIQPLSTVHGRRYADYSHGVRLVSTNVYIDGRFVAIEEALDDRAMSQLLSYEGRFRTYASILETAAHGGSDPGRRRSGLYALLQQ